MSSDPGLRFQAVDAFVDLVEALALGGPLVLGIDDAQWADPCSLLVLNAVTRRLADLPLGLICCLRPAPQVEELRLTLGTLHAAGAQHLRLERLSQRTILDLASDVLDADPERQLTAQLSAASGNPLFVHPSGRGQAQPGSQAARHYPALGPDLVRLALATGHRKRAEQVASAVTDLAASQDASPITGAALRCRGLLDRDADMLRAAADFYAASAYPLETAIAHEEAATVLAGDGVVDSAATLFDEALTTFERASVLPATSRAPKRDCASWASVVVGGEAASVPPSGGTA